MAAVIMAEDIVIRTTNTAVAPPMAVFIAVVRSQAVLFVAVRTQEAALLPEAEAHMSLTAAADAGGNKLQAAEISGILPGLTT